MSLATYTTRFAAGLAFAIVTLLGATTAVAQSPSDYDSTAAGPIYQPARPSPIPPIAGLYHASSLAEGSLRGQADVISALGNHKVDDAQASILREQGRGLNRVNNLKQTEALLAQEKMWDDARIQARNEHNARLAAGQQLLEERRATIYRQAYQLPARELNLATGAISWPAALQDAKFQANRAQAEELFRQHVGYRRTVTANEIARAVDTWSRTLRNEVGSMPREDYLAAQKFLTGLKYSAASIVEST